MSVEVEVVQLEGVDLDAAPPCSMTMKWLLFGLTALLGGGRVRLCGRPATHRVKVTCPVCGPRLVFLCRRHRNATKAGLASCAKCDYRKPIQFGGES
jgi:hypothetical protein